MGNRKISQMPIATTVTDAVVPIVQGGVNKKAAASLFGGGSASYLVYTALLTQSGTDAPVATVLQNTLGGTVVWSYDGAGYYIGTLANAFPEGKVILFIGTAYDGDFAAYGVASLLFFKGILNEVYINTFFVKDGVQTYSNGILLATSIEIRVYP